MPSSLKCLEYDREEANYLAAVLCLFTALSVICAILSAEWLLVDGPLGSFFDEANAFFGLTVGSNFTTTQFTFNASYPLVESTTVGGQQATILLPCASIGARVFWLPARFGLIYRDDGLYYNTFFLRDKIVLINCINPAVAYLFYLSIAFCFGVVGLASFSAVIHLFKSSFKFLNLLRDYVILESCCALFTTIIFLLIFRAKNKVHKMRPNSEIAFGSGLFYICAGGAFALLAAMLSLHQKSRLQKIRKINNQQLICTRSLRSWRTNLGSASSYENMSANPRDLERYLMNTQRISSS